MQAMKPVRILYVEDNAELRETFLEMLEGDNRQVTAHADGEQALAAWQAGSFDVLITDISLPGMSGTELARRVLAADPATWVVLCSGYEYASSIATLGAHVRALPKPFEMDELDRLMDEIAGALKAR